MIPSNTGEYPDLWVSIKYSLCQFIHYVLHSRVESQEYNENLEDRVVIWGIGRNCLLIKGIPHC